MTTEATSPAVTPARRREPWERFNPFSAEFGRDPYPSYRMLRDNAPVQKALGMWVLTRYEDVMTVLRDRSYSVELVPQQFTNKANRLSPDRQAQVNVDQILMLGEKSLVFTDNPGHTRLRRLSNRVFTAKAVAKLHERVTGHVEHLLERAWERGGMDVMTDLAEPLPSMVLGDWMDLPDDLRERVGPWTHEIRGLLEPALLRPADLPHVSSVLETFSAALDALIAERRARPGDDLISQFITARTGNGDKLTDEEVRFICIICYFAGNETTKSVIGNGILALQQHPDQDERLRREPQLVNSAVEEILRFDCPIQMTKRIATRDLQIGDKEIAEGEQVLPCLGAANRDPAVFDRPDEFDIARDPNPHVAFGYGMHGCLGGPLATLQARIVFQQLYSRRERLEMVEPEQLVWQDHSSIVRGLATLPVNIVGSAG
jgi:cytochrome P450